MNVSDDTNEVLTFADRLLSKIRDLKADRDEWKQQHENLLAIYQAQTRELAALKAELAKR